MMRNKKGFTLAELLIVIAIIAVLVAAAVPVFSAQLEKARKAVDDSNLRIAKSVATTNYLSHGCVVSDCPGDCGTSHNSGCWYDTDSGRIYFSDSVPPEKGYNQCTQIQDLSEYLGPILEFPPKSAIIWTGNGNSTPDKIEINYYWSSIS